jgi:hypothetical protein
MEPDEEKRKDLTEQAVKARFEWLSMESEDEANVEKKVKDLKAEISSLEKDLDDKLRKALHSVPPNTEFKKAEFERSEVSMAMTIVRSLAEAKSHLDKREAWKPAPPIDEKYKARRGEKKAAYEKALNELVATFATPPPGRPVR